MRSEFHRIEQKGRNVEYQTTAITFGQSPGGKDAMFRRNRTNGETFSNRAMQMAWNLRLRAQRTVQLLHGEPGIDPSTCLFIDPALGKGGADSPKLETYLAILSRPLWREDQTSGKLALDKRAKTHGEDPDSPDEFDATCLAFARDSDSGLRAF